MHLIRSWAALLKREYLEHRIAFVYFPMGILAILVISAVSGLSLNKFQVAAEIPMFSGVKIFELGYLMLIALWLAYLIVTLFFYFGDSFAADRRNNAMFFWKSMPVSDLKMLASKFLAGATMFPLMILAIAAVSGVVLYIALVIAGFSVPMLASLPPLAVLMSFLQVSAFALVFVGLAMLWYVPFMAWVGGLSSVFGRWSLPLAFLIPGILAVVENMVFFGRVPTGGYIWGYLSRRWDFGLTDVDYGLIATLPGQFNAGFFLQRLLLQIDWPAMFTGWAFAAVVVWLASEYRRRRIN